MLSLDAASLRTGARGDELIAGKYRLEHVLGEGGMGVVHAAEHVDLQKRVAIKILRHELSSQVELAERMIAEARTVARLRSEHVATVIDVGQLDSGAPFIVMEYLDGCDLATQLNESVRLPVETAVGYLVQACEAVAEAHAVGIVHRDIKPENLFLSARTDGEPIIKVLDFGISRNMRSGQRETEGLLTGSPDYMAPESMGSGRPIGPAADIWSIGAVLYELLTGQRPFEGATVSETCTRVVSSAPTAPRLLVPTIPAALEDILLRCLRKDPSERFASVVDLANALAPFGPAGALEQAQRVERVAAGGRWTPTGPRVNVVSFTDLPNSTSAVVSGTDTSLSIARLSRPRWHAPVFAALAAAAAAVVTLAVVEQRPAAAPPVVVAAVAAAAPTSATTPETAAVAAALVPAKDSAVPASASVRPPITAPHRKAAAVPVHASSPSPSAMPLRASLYDDDRLASAAPSENAPAPTVDDADNTPAPAASASTDRWSPESL